jgi:CRP/FNR family transcriptional regulator
MLNHEEVDFLYKALPFFQKLDRNDQDMIATTAFCSMYSSGDIIFSKERECEGLIIIKSGQLRASGWEMVRKHALPPDGERYLHPTAPVF